MIKRIEVTCWLPSIILAIMWCMKTRRAIEHQGMMVSHKDEITRFEQ